MVMPHSIGDVDMARSDMARSEVTDHIVVDRLEPSWSQEADSE